jgi:hypothetical protein
MRRMSSPHDGAAQSNTMSSRRLSPAVDRVIDSAIQIWLPAHRHLGLDGIFNDGAQG